LTPALVAGKSESSFSLPAAILEGVQQINLARSQGTDSFQDQLHPKMQQQRQASRMLSSWRPLFQETTGTRRRFQTDAFEKSEQL